MGWLRENYIESGQVRFVYRHLAAQGSEAIRSAEASECAAEQEQFWAYHDWVYANQVKNQTRLTDEVLINIATEIGLIEKSSPRV